MGTCDFFKERRGLWSAACVALFVAPASDVRDESDFSGLRVVFELLPEASPREVWRQLVSSTALEVSVQCNFVALKDGKHPHSLSIRYIAWFMDSKL